MASLPICGAPAPPPLSDEQLLLLISLSASIAPPPQCTMNDIQSILHKVSASLAQCRSSLALACSRAAVDATHDDTSQVLFISKLRSSITPPASSQPSCALSLISTPPPYHHSRICFTTIPSLSHLLHHHTITLAFASPPHHHSCICFTTITLAFAVIKQLHYFRHNGPVWSALPDLLSTVLHKTFPAFLCCSTDDFFQLVILADTYKCLCRVEDCGKEFAKAETRTALLSLATSCRTDMHCISVCRAIRNLTLSTAGQRLFAHVETRDGFLRMAACISSDDGREAWARAVCRCRPVE
jgi:hypothetical protein